MAPRPRSRHPSVAEQPQGSVFELHRLADHGDASLLAELRRVAALEPVGALTVTKFLRHAHVGPKPYRRFGRWDDALRAAGLSDRSSDVVRTRGAHPAVWMSDEAILDALRRLAGELGKTVLTVDDVDANLAFSGATLRNRWGTARKAFAAAGLTPSALGVRYSDEDCFANMLAVWTHYGRPPMYREMGEPPSIVGSKAYIRRFGTWNKALVAFAERVNGPDGGSISEVAEGEDPATTQNGSPTRGKANLPGEDRRDIPLGLRFKVLHRDRFKCVVCGDHPALNPACVLHVDHILPWSRGGKTREDNLRTLCEACNVGRGNRFTE